MIIKILLAEKQKASKIKHIFGGVVSLGIWGNIKGNSF